MFDRAMAQISNATTNFGAFLETQRMVAIRNSIIQIGLRWYALQHLGQQKHFTPMPVE
jgi:hypothetical protein